MLLSLTNRETGMHWFVLSNPLYCFSVVSGTGINVHDKQNKTCSTRQDMINYLKQDSTLENHVSLLKTYSLVFRLWKKPQELRNLLSCFPEILFKD